MLLGELVKDDIKNSLYAKTKDYYTEGSKDDKAKDFDLGKALTGLVDFAYEGISEDSKSMDDDLNGKDIIVIEGNFKNKRGVVIDDRSDSGGFVKVKFSNGTIGLVYAKNIQLSSTDSCKTGDVTYGGKGYRCVKCHATADSVHKIAHVRDEENTYKIEGNYIKSKNEYDALKNIQNGKNLFSKELQTSRR